MKTFKVIAIPACTCAQCSIIKIGMSVCDGRILTGTVIDKNENAWYLTPPTYYEVIRHYINTFIPGKVEYLS